MMDYTQNISLPIIPRDEYVFSGAMPVNFPGNDTHCVWSNPPVDGTKIDENYTYLPSPICLAKQLLYLYTNTSVSPEMNNTFSNLPYVRITATNGSSSSNSSTSSTFLTLPPLSYGFMVLLDAQASACM